MTELDPHTHQINLWIGLAEGDPTFSTTLQDAGYVCSVVEDEFYISDDDGGEIINPDLILTSQDAEHSILVECKSESIDLDQVRRYLRVNGNESSLVLQGLVDGVSPENISAETVLSSFSEIDNGEIPNRVAIVQFKRSPGSGLSVWMLDNHMINEETAADVFPVNLKPADPLPVGYYPFDIYEADKEAMVATIFSTVISLAVKHEEIDLDDVKRQSHPYWGKIGETKRKEFSERIERVYHELLNSGLEEYLEKIAGTNGKQWRVVSHSIQAVQGRTDYYVDRVLDNLPQARLDSDAWGVSDQDE